MNIDIRLRLDVFEHPKMKKLARRLGPEAVLCLLRLWLWAASARPHGVLDGMDAEDVELAADWNGEAGALLDALVEVHLLDALPEAPAPGAGPRERRTVYAIHDWREHQAWASCSEERSRRARHAAQARWNGALPEEKKKRPGRSERPAPRPGTSASFGFGDASASFQEPMFPDFPAPAFAPNEATPNSFELGEATPGGFGTGGFDADEAAPIAGPCGEAVPAAHSASAFEAEAAPLFPAAPEASSHLVDIPSFSVVPNPANSPAELSGSPSPAADPLVEEHAPGGCVLHAPCMRAHCSSMRPASSGIAPLNLKENIYPPIPLTGDSPQGGHAPELVHPLPAHEGTAKTAAAPCLPGGVSSAAHESAALPAELPAAPRSARRSRRRFQPPSVEEVAAFCREQGLGISAQRFVEYYTAKGWTIGGRSPMRDWQAAARLWERRDREDGHTARPAPGPGVASGPQGEHGAGRVGVIQRARASSVHQAQLQERDLMARLILEKTKVIQQDKTRVAPLSLPVCGVPTGGPTLELDKEGSHAFPRRHARPADAAQPALPPEWARGL